MLDNDGKGRTWNHLDEALQRMFNSAVSIVFVDHLALFDASFLTIYFIRQGGQTLRLFDEATG